MTTFLVAQNEEKENEKMINNNEKSAEILSAAAQAKARLAEIKRKEEK